MTLHDGTPRERYTDPRNAHGDRPPSGTRWGTAGIVIVAIVALLALATALLPDRREVTNAPADAPPSTQQPDATPPTNQEPAGK